MTSPHRPALAAHPTPGPFETDGRRHGSRSIGAALLRAADARGREEVLLSVDPYKPIQDWAERLRWDGRPRVDTWLTTYLGAVDTPTTRRIGRGFLTGAMARLLAPEGYAPGAMPVLVAPQGAGKTSVLRSLCAAPGWFCDAPVPPYPGESLSGALLREVEIDTLRPLEARRLKSLLASTHEAPPFRAARVPARCSFIGTANEIPENASEHRRFWSVRCGETRPVARAVEADVRDQLWAEARDLYRAGAQTLGGAA
jgi:putative DNA primase/helicase